MLKVSIERDGKWYCRIHDPEKVAVRNEINAKKWRDEAAAKRREVTIQNAKEAVVQAAKDWRVKGSVFELTAAVKTLEALENAPKSVSQEAQ